MHFSKDDWLLYINNNMGNDASMKHDTSIKNDASMEHDALIDEEKKLQMEEHLINCDICMENYMSVCENLCTEVSSNNPLSVNFVHNIMDEIKNYDLPITKNKKPIIPNMFLYYTAAACITLLLMKVNVFQNISSHIFPHTATNTVTVKNYLQPSLRDNLFKNIKIK